MKKHTIEITPSEELHPEVQEIIRLSEERDQEQAADFKFHFKEITFEEYKEKGMKIIYDDTVIDYYFPQFNNHLTFPNTISIIDILNDYSKLKNTKQGLTLKDYVNFRSSPYISKRLYNYTEGLFQDKNIKVEEQVIGTICMSLLKFWADFKYYESTKEFHPTKEQNEINLKFYTFLEMFEKSEFALDDVRIKIQATNTNGTFECLMPNDWFDFIIKHIRDSYKFEGNVYSFEKEAAELSLSENKTRDYSKNTFIRTYIVGLSKLLEDVCNMKVSNQRNYIIGYLLSYIEVFPTIDYAERVYKGNPSKYFAERVKEMIRQAK